MKLKILSLLLAMSLLLTACGPARPGNEADETTVPPNTAEVPPETAVPSDTAEVPATAPAGTQPWEVPVTEPAPTTAPPAVLPGGWQVYTDPSQYSSYTPPAALYTKPEGRDYSTFTPREDLGLIYPYASAALYSSTEEGYSYRAGSRLGFVSRDGEILTDGIYTGISPLVDYRSLYSDNGEMPELLKQAPIWIMEQMGEVTVQHVESPYGNYDYPEGSSLYGMAAMDGSFALPCVYGGIQLLSDGGHILCRKDWDDPDLEIYDTRGRLLLTGSNLLGAYRDCNAWSVDYSEGLYCVEATFYASDGGSEDTSVAWFADDSGRRVLGPYRSCSPFHDGLACVSQDGSTYGYIDKTGAWVIPPRFNWSADFENGRCAQSTWDDTRYVIDKTGRELITTYNGYISTAPCGYYVDDDYYVNGEEHDHTTFFDRDGNIVLSEEGDWTCVAQHVFARSVDGGMLLRSDLPETEDLRIDDANYVYSSVLLLDGKLVHGLRGAHFAREGSVFILPDLSGTIEIDEDDPTSVYGYDSAYNVYDEMTGAGFWMMWDGDESVICDVDGTIYARTRMENPRLIGGRLYEVGDLACVYRDPDGALLFSYPIMAED